MYLGVEGKIDTLTHHNLLSALDWDKNFDELTTSPTWPEDPSLYVCAPSKTDSLVAPEGMENLFVLVPVASGLTYNDEYLESYSEKILTQNGNTFWYPRFEKKELYTKNSTALKNSVLIIMHSKVQHLDLRIR